MISLQNSLAPGFGRRIHEWEGITVLFHCQDLGETSRAVLIASGLGDHAHGSEMFHQTTCIRIMMISDGTVVSHTDQSLTDSAVLALRPLLLPTPRRFWTRVFPTR
jgi:hypothetical protein